MINHITEPTFYMILSIAQSINEKMMIADMIKTNSTLAVQINTQPDISNREQPGTTSTQIQ